MYTIQLTVVKDEVVVLLNYCIYFIFVQTINKSFDSGKYYEDFVAAIDFILKDRVIIAMAETPYVIDGPKVQYEAQAGKNHEISFNDMVLKTYRVRDPMHVQVDLQI